MTTGIQQYSTTPATNSKIGGTSGKSIAEGCAYANLNDAIRQMASDIRSWYDAAEWVNYGTGTGAGDGNDPTYTYVGATQFKISGSDQTIPYHVGRRVKIVAATPGTIYGTISVSSFSTDTTITVVFDSGSLSNEALTVYLAAASATSQSLPQSSETIKGTVELATTTEATTGTDTARAVTPAGVKAVTDALSIPGAASTTVAGSVELAIQAEAVAATDAARVAALNMMHHHPGIAKAFGTFAGADGTIETDASYGVTSVTRNSTGIYTINFSVTFANNDYTVVGMATSYSSTQESADVAYRNGGTRTTTACQINVSTTTDVVYDPAEVSFVVYGKLA